MPKLSLQSVVPAVVLVAVLTSACSKGSSSSPLAPSMPASPAVTGSPAPAAAGTGATISGQVVSGDPQGLSAQTLTPAGRATVSVNGTSLSAVSDDNGVFTLQNVPAGSVTLTVAGSGYSAQVTVGTVNVSDDIRLTVRVTGSSAKVDDSRHQSADNQVEFAGTITAAGNGTITVGTTNTVIAVPTTASITNGGRTASIADLVAGVRVEIHAVLSGGVLTATRVHIEDGDDSNDDSDDDSDDDSSDDSDDDDNEAKVSGVIASAPSGSCPAISFTVGGTAVVTNSSTRFDDVACSALAKGTVVTVEGTTQPNGSILALELKASRSGSTSGNSSNSGSGSGSNSGSSSNSGSGSNRGRS